MLIEKQFALQEFGDLKAFSEHRFIIVGLFFLTLATFILGLEFLFQVQSGTVFTMILIPIYLVFRGLGGFLISAALISLALKTGYRSITPTIRAALVLGAVFIIIAVLVLIPPFNYWVLP